MRQNIFDYLHYIIRKEEEYKVGDVAKDNNSKQI